MEAIIQGLVNRFEKGALSRRQLVQALTMLTAAGGAASAQEPAIKAAKIDHVSIQVSDLPRSIAFYEKMFGLTVMGEDKPNEIVRLGSGKILVAPSQESDRCGGSLCDWSREVQPRGRDPRAERKGRESRRQPGRGISHQGSGRNQCPDCRRMKSTQQVG
jgi:hypothetical protein